MPNKSLQELKDEFKRDYSSAVSFYNVNDIIHFYRDIRPSIENFGKLILFDIVGEQTFHNIEDNNEFVNESGDLRPQRPDYTVQGAGWIRNAEYAFKRKQNFDARDHMHTNLRNKILAGMDLLYSQYSEASEIAEHTGVKEDNDRMVRQANLCICGFVALFQSVSDYISEDLNNYFTELPKPDETSGNIITIASSVLERETALSALDEYAHYFKRQDSRKFIAILPENASEHIRNI